MLSNKFIKLMIENNYIFESCSSEDNNIEEIIKDAC